MRGFHSKKMRFPDTVTNHVSIKNEKKWNTIIQRFMDENTDALLKINRGGSRGRIFCHLIKEMYNLMNIDFIEEPIFRHIEPNPWFVSFAQKYDIKLRIHPFYNPDFFLLDGTWVEITLSENTAYKKLFRFGHQAEKLRIIWLDEDDGRHKEICHDVEFPNIEILNIKSYFHSIEGSNGSKLVGHFKRLKELKGIIQ